MILTSHPAFLFLPLTLNVLLPLPFPLDTKNTIMKRSQDRPLHSSSSCRQNSPENLHSHTIGCMSGLFHLLSKYQKRRKFLTFGKKSEKSSGAVLATSPPPKKGAKSSATRLDRDVKKGTDQARRLSCDVPRSPTLPPEIRRSNPGDAAEGNFRRPVVARLMGLGEDPMESTVEKRRKLMGALERCDRDLKALKKIIKDVQSRNGNGSDEEGERKKSGAEEIRCSSVESSNGEQPSPVSVLDELTRSPVWRSHATCVAAPGAVKQKKRPGSEEDMINLSLLDRIMTGGTCFQTRTCGAGRLLSRKAMVESVKEACRDVAWGEKREVGRMGVALQDLICRDLVDEFVKEMSPYWRKSKDHCAYNSLPFQACKRKLRF